MNTPQQTNLLRFVKLVILKDSSFAHIANKLNISRTSLYKSLADNANPKLSTFLNILDELNLQITIRKKHGL